MASPRTTDLCDAHLDSVEPGRIQLVDPIFRDFGGCEAFFGQVLTVEAPDDNSKVREALAQPGQARVLVVEGHASRRCALLGDLLGELAVENGWSGVVVHGFIRDAARLSQLDLGVKALGAFPRKSQKMGRGSIGAPLGFAGVKIESGCWLYADSDGIVISSEKLA